MVNQRGQITIEYFIIAMAISAITVLTTATFHRQIKDTMLNFYEAAVGAIGAR